MGTGKNDGIDHIYSITNKKEEAPINYDVGRPVGNALQNASSTSSIYQKNEVVNTSGENNSNKAETQASYTPDDEQELTRMAREGEITAESFTEQSA